MARKVIKNKNSVENSSINVKGNLNIGDQPKYYLSNTPFTLLRSQHFLNRVQGDLLGATIPCFDMHQPLVNDFFQNSQKRILLIIGPNESGKTHLLRNIILEASNHSWESFSVESPVAGLPPQALYQNEPILIFRDDIDWEQDDFLVPVLQLLDSKPNIRLVLTAHQSWIKSIKQKIDQVKGLPGTVEFIELKNWNSDQLVTLLQIAANATEVKHEQNIVQQFSNPYLLKYFGESMVGNPKISIESISRNFAQKVKRVFEQNLKPELAIDKVQLFILYLVFDRVSYHTLTDFASTLGIQLEQLETILQRLANAGMIRKRMGYYFITPEIKGNFYVAGELENKAEPELREILSDFINYDAKRTMQKIVEVAQFVTHHTLKVLGSYLNDYIKTYEDKIRENPGLLDYHHLRIAEKVLLMEVRYGESTATHAAFSIVSFAILYQTEASRKQSLGEDTLNSFTDVQVSEECAQFLETAVCVPRKRDDYLAILQVIWKSGYKSHAHNYQPETLLTNAFKPFDEYNNFESFNIGLQYARHWLIESDDLQLQHMGVIALQTILGAFFEYFGSEYNTVAFGTSILPDNSQLFKLRSNAISLAKEALHKESTILHGLRILDHIGQGKRFHSHEDLLNLAVFPNIQEEIESCIPIIGSILCSSSDFLIQKTAETTLLNWWLWGISESMEPWLLQFERTPEYLLYRHIIDNRIMTEDFAKTRAKAPQTKRWDWFWKKSDLKEKRKLGSIEQYKDLAHLLSKKYTTPQKIAHFIKESSERVYILARRDQKDVSHITNMFCRVTRAWADITPARFTSLLMNTTLSEMLPEWTRSEIEIQLLANGSFSSNQVALPLLARIPSLNYAEMSQLVFLIQKQQPAEKELWLEKMIEQGQEPMLHDIASRLCFIFKESTEINSIAKCLLQILISGKITQQGFFGKNFTDAAHAYEYLFAHRSQLSPDLDEQLREVTFDYIKKMSKIEASEKNALEYCIRTGNQLIELFNFRASHFAIESIRSTSDFQIRDVLLDDVFSVEELHEIFKYPEIHRQFIDKIAEWEQAALHCMSDWRNPYLDVYDLETKELWIIQHLRQAIQENNLLAIEYYNAYIPQDEAHIEIMLQAWHLLLPNQSDEQMKDLLYEWATYHRKSGGFYPLHYNRYEAPKTFWEKVSNRPIFDLHLKNLVQRVAKDLEKRWKNNQEE